jgi:hypothetical protein
VTIATLSRPPRHRPERSFLLRRGAASDARVVGGAIIASISAALGAVS